MNLDSPVEWIVLSMTQISMLPFCLTLNGPVKNQICPSSIVNNITSWCHVSQQTSAVLSWFIAISVCVYRVTNRSPSTVWQSPSGKNGTVLNSVDTEHDGDRLSQPVKYTPLSSVTHTSYDFIADIYWFITFVNINYFIITTNNKTLLFIYCLNNYHR